MPSFDIVSELEKHQVTNAIDQSNRIVANRFDFKGVDARFEYADKVVTMVAEADIQVQQMLDILRQALIKCGIDIACLDIKEPEQSGKTVKQSVTLREGIGETHHQAHQGKENESTGCYSGRAGKGDWQEA